MDTVTQVSLVWKGFFSEEYLKPSRRPVHLKVPDGEPTGVGSHEATISMEPWEHDRLNRPDLWKRIVLSRNFMPRIFLMEILLWDMILL